jgi:hypothetical protein
MGLQLKAIQPPTTKRVHDEVLMDRASKMDKKQMSDKLMERINRCRNFMRAETIADVATLDGKYICLEAYKCNVEVRIQSKKLWPNQPHVGTLHTKSWQWFLKLWYKDGSLELRQPLGTWLVEPTGRGWSAYYVESTDMVLTQEDGSWREHEVLEKQRIEWNLCDHHAIKTAAEVKAIEGKIPIEAWQTKDGFIDVCKPHGSWKDWKDTSATARNAKDWDEYKSMLPECVREILKGCTEVDRKGKLGLLEILQSETRVLNICSDGGHINNRGSYGWVIATAGSIIYKGKGHARGHPNL